MQTYFSRSRLFVIVAFLLFAANVAVLSYVLIRDRRDVRPFPAHGPGGSPRIGHLLKKELDMTGEQYAAYAAMIDEHRAQRDEYLKATLELRKKLLRSIGQNNDSLTQQLTDEIGRQQAQFEMNTYKHFLAVYNLLNDGQKKNFSRLMDDVARKIGPMPPPSVAIPPHEGFSGEGSPSQPLPGEDHPPHGPHNGPPPHY